MLSEVAMKLLMELRARNARRDWPAKSNDVLKAAGVAPRDGTAAWGELEAVGRIDRNNFTGKASDVWLTDGREDDARASERSERFGPPPVAPPTTPFLSYRGVVGMMQVVILFPERSDG